MIKTQEQMKEAQEGKRLKAIKDRFVIFPTKCKCCKDTISFEKMWLVYRWGVDMKAIPYHYCSKCMPTAQDVLNKIDNEARPFGIAYVDKFIKPGDNESTLKRLLKLKAEKEKKS